jgi:uncharacterized protein (UPF0332 family)
MPFRWSEYLDLAQELLSRDLSPASDEAKLRAAVSRAYYAALQSAKTRLIEKDYYPNIPTGGPIHRFVIDQFRDHPEEARKKIGIDLARLCT